MVNSQTLHGTNLNDTGLYRDSLLRGIVIREMLMTDSVDTVGNR